MDDLDLPALPRAHFEARAFERVIGVLSAAIEKQPAHVDQLWQRYEEIYAAGIAHDLVQRTADVLAEQHAVRARQESLVNMADMLALARRMMGPARLVAEDERACQFMDEGWSGDGWKPSELYRIGINAVSASKVGDFRKHVLGRARQRFRDGYRADPFTPEPVRRAA